MPRMPADQTVLNDVSPCEELRDRRTNFKKRMLSKADLELGRTWRRGLTIIPPPSENRDRRRSAYGQPKFKIGHTITPPRLVHKTCSKRKSKLGRISRAQADFRPSTMYIGSDRPGLGEMSWEAGGSKPPAKWKYDPVERPRGSKV